MEMRVIRKPPRQVVETAVLHASRRRCCLCVFLEHRNEVRPGQICHLSRNPSRSEFDDLVWLCLEHHDQFDSKTSQSKGFTIHEVRTHRDNLYEKNSKEIVGRNAGNPELNPLPEDSIFDSLRRRFPEETEYLSRPWHYPLWQTANEPEFFSYKSHSCDGVCLIERIDIPNGKIVVACIQPLGNPGNSITNCVEEICFQVCERFDIPPASLIWLEHYDDGIDDEWRLVTFKLSPPSSLFCDPEWTVMTPNMWRDLRLKPKKKMARSYGFLGSKIEKLFPWPEG